MTKMNKELKLIDNKLYIKIKSIEKIDGDFYRITFMNGQTFLIKGDKNEMLW